MAAPTILNRAGFSLTSTTGETPSVTSSCTICSGLSAPSAGWPPVIATASL
ncbi:MAG: hypothetical protein R3D89_07815 [Sphingomonadaceae bacterium]